MTLTPLTTSNRSANIRIPWSEPMTCDYILIRGRVLTNSHENKLASNEGIIKSMMTFDH